MRVVMPSKMHVTILWWFPYHIFLAPTFTAICCLLASGCWRLRGIFIQRESTHSKHATQRFQSYPTLGSTFITDPPTTRCSYPNFWTESDSSERERHCDTSTVHDQKWRTVLISRNDALWEKYSDGHRAERWNEGGCSPLFGTKSK